MTEGDAIVISADELAEDPDFSISYWLPDGWIAIPVEELETVAHARQALTERVEAGELDARLADAIIEIADRPQTAPPPITLACAMLEDDAGSPVFASWSITRLDMPPFREAEIPDAIRRRVEFREVPVASNLVQRAIVIQDIVSATPTGPHLLLMGSSPRDDLTDDLTELFADLASRVVIRLPAIGES